MAVKIRLRRMGRKNGPFYRVVATDERRPVKGGYIENLGWYDPKMGDQNYALKLDRVDHWVGVGAQMSDTVSALVRRARVVASQGPSMENAVRVEAPAEEVIEEAVEEVVEETAEA